MSYRDEGEALRAKVADLEDRLEDANATIARLRGESGSAAGSEVKHGRVLGGPASLALEHDLPFEVSAEGYEAIAAVLKSRCHLVAFQVGRRLTAGSFSMTYADGVTRISVQHDFSAGATAAVLSASLLGGGFTTMAAAAVLHDGAHISPAYALLAMPLLLAGAAGAMRALVQRASRRQAKALTGAFEAIVELAEEHAVRPAARVRVDAEETEEEDALEGARVEGRGRARAK